MPVGAPDWSLVLIWVRELASPSKATGPVMIYRAKRMVTYSSFKLLTNATDYGIFSASDDEVPSASITNNTSITDLTYALDHDDDTAASGTITVPASSWLEAIIVDLGSSAYRFIRVKFETPGALPNKCVSVSDDGVTWADLYCDTSNPIDYSGGASFRYLALRVQNTSTSDITYNISIYSVEAYTPNAKDVLQYYDVGEDTITVFVKDGSYFLYEVIYEAAPP